MCFSLHWDGTFSRGLDLTPICVGVANTNSSDVSAQFCLGYMPELTNQGKVFHSTPLATEVKFYIRQTAVSHVLRVLEGAAKSGVLCPFKNADGIDIALLLYPRLVSVPIDQKEAQLFYGMKNRWSCSKCTRRGGYSAFRRCSPQDGNAITRYYSFACDTNSEWQDLAKKQLGKLGFNPSRQCQLPVVCDSFLVRVNDTTTTTCELFPSIDYRDKMHGMFIFLHNRMHDILTMITWPTLRNRRSAKYLLDQRIIRISSQRTVSTDNTGRSIRSQTSIFNDAGMTAADRVSVLCLLPYVFGHRGLLIPAEVRQPLLRAIATVQLVVLAARGRREYSRSELVTIFDRGYVEIFKCFEYINAVCNDKKYEQQLADHRRNPQKYKPPTVYKSNMREDDTDTDGTSDSVKVGGTGRFSHGVFNLVHQHWVMQCVHAGGFNVHDTEGAEAYHKTCMTLAASRVRHSRMVMNTCNSMRDYLLNNLLFRTIEQVFYPPKSPTPRSPVAGVHKPLRNFIGSEVHCTRLGKDIGSSLQRQTRILHPEVRVACVELFDMLCLLFGMPTTVASYAHLEKLDWSFGQKLVTEDGEVFWATQTQYATAWQKGGYRRDCLLLEGTEDVKTRSGMKTTALCCQCMCFIDLGNMDVLFRRGVRLPRHLSGCIIDDHLRLILVRWFSPHPAATERCSSFLPVCPPPFHMNHALWQYSKCDVKRPVFFDRQGRPNSAFHTQAHAFGTTQHERMKTLESEARAYYGVVKLSSIQSRAVLFPEFEEGALTASDTWLQSVTWH